MFHSDTKQNVLHPGASSRRSLAAARIIPVGLFITAIVLGSFAVLAPFDVAAQQSAVAVQRQLQVRDLAPTEVAKGVAEGRYLLVDVRELDEVAAEAFPSAVNMPLSRFDPRHISDLQGREVVFACHTGRRSTVASLHAQATGFGYDKHLAGGIDAWKAAGLPTKRGP